MLFRLTTLLLFLIAFSTGKGQTFLNGSFETNTSLISRFNLANGTFNTYMSNSFAYGAGNAMDIVNNSSTFAPAQSGNWFVAVEYQVAGDAFTMRLSAPLVSGATYTMCYWDKGFDDGAGSPCCPPASPLQIGVSTVNNAQGTVVYTSPTPTINAWTQRTFTFVAPNNGQYISITNTAWRWTLVDNFTIAPGLSCIPPLAAQVNDIWIRTPRPGTNEIFFSASNENELEKFVLERSSNGISFHSISELPAIISPAYTNEHMIPDSDFEPGLNYYRIRMVDFNGVSTFSKIVSAMSGAAGHQLTIVPNPNNGTFHLEHPFEISQDENAVLRIYNGSGILVYESKDLPGRFTSEELELYFLAAGPYFALLQYKEQVATGKFIIQ